MEATGAGGLARVLRVGRGPAEWIVAGKAGGLFVHRSQWDWGVPLPERVYATQLMQEHVDHLLATAWWPTVAGEGEGKVHVVHRLDRPASGCLVAALSPQWAALLQRCMSHPSANKTYLAHVRGNTPHAEAAEVNVPLARNGSMKASVSVVRSLNPTPPEPPTAEPTAKSSRWINKDSSLFFIQLRSGRWHQARRHCRFLSHPIIGDTTHGDLPVNHHWQATTQYPRLGLHCFSLDIPLPTPDRVEAYARWWADKELVRDRRRAEMEPHKPAEGGKGKEKEKKMSKKRKEEDEEEEEDEEDDIAVVEEDEMDPELLQRQKELDAILGLDETPERLRVLCPVPDDLLRIWRAQEWWAEAVERLPALGWTAEEVERRAREADLYGAGWPIAREVPARFIVGEGQGSLKKKKKRR